MSRVPVYFTVAPVCCCHGSTIFRNAACSSPPHVPITVTVLPLRLLSSVDEPPDEQAVAASVMTVNGTNVRSHGLMGTPPCCSVPSRHQARRGAPPPGRRLLWHNSFPPESGRLRNENAERPTRSASGGQLAH